MSLSMVLTNEALKGLMPDAMVNRVAVCKDMDTVTMGGYQPVTPETANIPAGAYQYGILLNYFLGSWMWMQIYIPHNAGYGVFLRVRFNGSTSRWRKLSETVV